MAGRRARRAIQNPQALINPRVLTPIDQIQQHYGGRAATEAAIKDAEELARQLSVIHDPKMVGPDGYREYFPEIDYGRYDEDILVNPIPGDGEPFDPAALDYEVDAGRLTTPGSEPDFSDLIQMQGGSFVPAPPEASEMPAITFFQDKNPKNPVAILDDADTDLDPYSMQLEVDRQMGEGLRRGKVSRSVEEPMTEFITGGDGAKDDRVAFYNKRNPGQQSLSTLDADKILAQIRRSSGQTVLDPVDAERLLSESTGRLNRYLDITQRADPKGFMRGLQDGSLGRDMVDAATGLTMQQLRYLRTLPKNVIAKFPTRIRELVALGGVTSGLLGEGGSSDRQGIDPRSTTGPLGGLMDY